MVDEGWGRGFGKFLGNTGMSRVLSETCSCEFWVHTCLCMHTGDTVLSNACNSNYVLKQSLGACDARQEFLNVTMLV